MAYTLLLKLSTYSPALTVAMLIGLIWTSTEIQAGDKKKSAEDTKTAEWAECTQGYYDLLSQRQQLTATIDHPKKNYCKSGARIKAKPIKCPEGKKFSDITPDLRSQIDALMGADAEDYPFTDDPTMEKVYERVVKNANHLLDAKCEKISELDN